MIMTWQDYIFVSCGISTTIALIGFISLVIIHARDKKKSKNEKPFNKDFFDWNELK